MYDSYESICALSAPSLNRTEISMSQPAEDHSLLAALAVALVDHPRATLTELAKTVGISKASLYRLCNTREQLIETVVKEAGAALDHVIEAVDFKNLQPEEALKQLADLKRC
jgi:TetR/AcrR family transcriptional repressor of mexCD-oprJ operon